MANLRRGNPAPAGNQRRRTHGAYAQVAAGSLDEKTAEVFNALAADAPLRDGDGGLPAADSPMVRLAAETLCRIDSVSSWLAMHGWVDAKGQPRQGILDLERRLRAEAADHLDALGMSPRSRARLGLDMVRTADLAELMAEAARSTIETGAVDV